MGTDFNNINYLKEFTVSEHQAEHNISDWQKYFAVIFSQRNERLQERFIWLKVVEKATHLAEAIRKYHYDEATQHIARLFCWLCSFCTNNETILGTTSLNDIIWWKYPYVCPHCAPKLKQLLESGNLDSSILVCICDTKKIEEQKDKGIDEKTLDWFRNRNEKLKKEKLTKLDGWMRMFQDLYESRIELLSLDSIAFHLLEEVGEVICVLRNYSEIESTLNLKEYKRTNKMVKEAMRRYEDDKRIKPTKKDKISSDKYLKRCQSFLKNCMKEEVADVFSWLAAVVIKITRQRRRYISYDKRYIESCRNAI